MRRRLLRGLPISLRMCIFRLDYLEALFMMNDLTFIASFNVVWGFE